MRPTNPANISERIILEMDQKTLSRYRGLAEKQGIGLALWIRNVLEQVHPEPFSLKIDEEGMAPSATAIHSESSVKDRPGKDSSVKKEEVKPSHPCANLKKAFLPPYTERDCSGWCNKLQRVCMWPPAAAKSCTTFDPILRLPIVRIDPGQSQRQE